MRLTNKENMKMNLLNNILNKAKKIKQQIYFKIEELYYYLDLNGEYYIEEKPHNIEFVEGTKEDLGALIECDPILFGDKKIQRFQNRLDAGERLFLIRLNGKIGNYVWQSYKEAQLAVGINKALDEGQVFLYDSHTFDAFRRRGLFKVAMFESIRLAKKEGYQEIYVTHLKNNFISQKVFVNIGYKLIKKYTLIRFFKKNYIREINITS